MRILDLLQNDRPSWPLSAYTSGVLISFQMTALPKFKKGSTPQIVKYLRELIREKQEAAMNALYIEAIRSALIEGEESGVSLESPDNIKQRVLARRAKNA